MIVCYRVESPARSVHAQAEAKWRATALELVDQSHPKGLVVTGRSPARCPLNWTNLSESDREGEVLQLSEAPARAREPVSEQETTEGPALLGTTSGDRAIRIKEVPARPTSNAADRAGGRQPRAAPLRHPPHEGFLELAVGWLGSSSALASATSGRQADSGGGGCGGSSAMNARSPAGGLPSGPAPEFTTMVEDPDTRRRRQQTVHKSERKQEVAKAKWRVECLAVGQQRRLQHIADMRLLWVSSGRHRSGAAVLIVVGAHYRPKIASTEDVLLYTVREFEKLSGRPYVVLYFNADAPMRRLPDTVWFQELHAALPGGHAQQLRGLFLVHPKSHWVTTRIWMIMLQGQNSQFYGKMQLVNDLEHMLATEFDEGVRRDVPQLVTDYRARHPGAA